MRAGVVNVQVGDDAGAICHELLARDVCTDFRGDGLRISPHFFNTEDDVDRCFDELRGGVGLATLVRDGLVDDRARSDDEPDVVERRDVAEQALPTTSRSAGAPSSIGSARTPRAPARS